VNPGPRACVGGTLALSRSPMRSALPVLFLVATAPASVSPQETGAGELLREALEGTGVALDVAGGFCSFPARVLVRNDLLEYLLVGRRGAAHESLFVTETRPSLLNAAILALGCSPGENARVEDGPVASVVPPRGGAESHLYLYAAWKEGEETYLYRVEDLLTNLDTGRAMQRHGWVYLGSRFASPRAGEPESFVCDLEENLINIAFFYQGNTLVTAGLEECVEQTIWAANAWLLPPSETEVRLVLSRHRLVALPPGEEVRLPLVPVGAGEAR